MQKNNIKNIHLFPINNKFNKNILDCESIYNVRFIDDTIYKYFYKNIDEKNRNNHTFIFNSSYLIPEVSDFIESLSKQFKIIIYIDNNKYLKDLKYDNVIYITQENTTEPLSNVKILPKNITSKSIYATEKNNKSNKDDSIIYFSQETTDSESIKKLEQYLYPSSNLRIKIFDNKNFKHPQNIGYTSELTKKELLSSSKYYLHDSSNYYTSEAKLCGCALLDIDKTDSLMDQIKNNKPESDTDDIVYYIDFMKDIIDE